MSGTMKRDRSGTPVRMQELALWRPDAFVDPDEYVAHVDLGLRALRRTARDDVRLTLTVEEGRPLIELVCVRPPDHPVPALVANLTDPDEAADPAFPAAPSAERLTALGWDDVSLGSVHAWALGPVTGFDARAAVPEHAGRGHPPGVRLPARVL